MLAGEVGAPFAARVSALDHHLGRDAGMVGAHHPQRVAALQPRMPRQDVLQGIVERMPDMERSSDVGRRDHDRERRRVGPLGAKPSRRLPMRIPARFDGRGVEGLVDRHAAALAQPTPESNHLLAIKPSPLRGVSHPRRVDRAPGTIFGKPGAFQTRRGRLTGWEGGWAGRNINLRARKPLKLGRLHSKPIRLRSGDESFSASFEEVFRLRSTQTGRGRPTQGDASPADGAKLSPSARP
jgi:hypothetical protein